MRKKGKRKGNLGTSSYAEIDNKNFIREDFLNEKRISKLDEESVKELVRIYNAELILHYKIIN